MSWTIIPLFEGEELNAHMIINGKFKEKNVEEFVQDLNKDGDDNDVGN